MTKILVIDDELQMRELLKKYLTRAGYEVTLAGDGDEGLRFFQLQPADLVITDLIMPEKEGLECIAALKKIDSGIKIIAISGGGLGKPEGYLELAIKMGAAKAFIKPFELKELLAAIRELTADEG
ncbi:MAG: response regulator [Deltaproteobacteria bacterium]|nr:response regulator [Deltaproteobacteria bacterium]